MVYLAMGSSFSGVFEQEESVVVDGQSVEEKEELVSMDPD